MVGGYKATGSMRLANQKNPFREREDKSGMRLPKIQYIIFAEGIKTEKLYFESLSRSKRKKENVIIRYLDRWKVNSGRSNQLSVVTDVIEYVDKVKAEKKINPRDLERLFKKLVEDAKVEELTKIINQLNKLTSQFPDLFTSKEGIQSQLFSCITLTNFDSEFDKLFIILDRDSHSFTNEQFKEVLAKSQTNNLNLGITNPCFEFFLLSHFEGISDLDSEKLKSNLKEGKKTYVEKLLNDYLFKHNKTSFKKNSYDTEFFINRTDTALINSEQFETNNECLEDNLGSSVINIIKEMID